LELHKEKLVRKKTLLEIFSVAMLDNTSRFVPIENCLYIQCARALKMTIDINCDMGEGMLTDEAIMPFISSANIACGYHAGDVNTIRKTIKLCLKHQVAIGAHPSFFDKENFGRTEMNLPEQEIYELVTQQLFLFNEIADSLDAKLHHIKPHGALYNMSAKNKLIARAIANAVKDFNKELILYGLSGSCSVTEAKVIGLKTANEVFADRTYQDDGSLTPRTKAGALIEDPGKAVKQIQLIVKDKTVRTIDDKLIPMTANTICIHGDGKHAVEFAKNIFEALAGQSINIKSQE